MFRLIQGLIFTWAYPLVDPAGQQTHIVGISLVSDDRVEITFGDAFGALCHILSVHY